MEEFKIKGIVIKSIDYKDSDKIVTIFSAELGIIHARARGVKKLKAKLAFATQPFAFCEFMLIAKGGFYSIINANLEIHSFQIGHQHQYHSKLIYLFNCFRYQRRTPLKRKTEAK